MTKLVELVAQETNINTENLMLLRHAGDNIRSLRALGGSVEDYTVMQPTATKYDYRNPKKPNIDVVVVVVDDEVYGVYRIRGVKKEGTNYSLASPALREFDKNRRKPERPSCLFDMVKLESVVTGKTITGWKNPRATVQRHGGKFFSSYEVNLPPNDSLPWANDLNDALEKRVRKAQRESKEARRRGLLNAPEIPERREARTTVFNRSAYVIEAVLDRASGRCELCKQPAPFSRKSDGSTFTWKCITRFVLRMEEKTR